MSARAGKAPSDKADLRSIQEAKSVSRDQGGMWPEIGMAVVCLGSNITSINAAPMQRVEASFLDLASHGSSPTGGVTG